MYITAINKTTLLDYPNHLASTLFLQGCNFLCPFCHNRDLIPLDKACPKAGDMTDAILPILTKRRHLIEGVCITGGEPTLHKDLPDLIRQIKKLGLKVKLDTNGSNPKLLAHLLNEQLLDYVAMDIKNTPSEYSRTCGTRVDMSKIEASLGLLTQHMSPRFSYELRTTVLDPLHTYAQLESIARWLSSQDIPNTVVWYLQEYVYSPMQVTPTPYTSIKKETLTTWLASLLHIHPSTHLRGYA